jgi:C-terminal processing protease CtpA/Prc
MADDGEDYDFEGNASIIALMAKMGDIDKALEDIHDIENEAKRRGEKAQDGSPTKGSNFYETPEEAAKRFEDVAVDTDDDDYNEDDDDDDVDAGLEDLQKEIQTVEEQESFVEETFTVCCVKPTPATPIGVSMKSSKGVTRIIGVNPSGLVAKAHLQPNVRLVSVNGEAVKNAKHAKFLIGRQEADVVLLVKTLPPLRLV